MDYRFNDNFADPINTNEKFYNNNENFYSIDVSLGDDPRKIYIGERIRDINFSI